MAHINYNADNPGPGAYYLNYKQVSLEAPKPTFGVRTQMWADKARPGPGTYNVRTDGNASPKYTMAKHYDVGPGGSNTPGPGAYHASLQHTHEQVPAYSLQGKYNYLPDKGSPGPGAYNNGSQEHSDPTVGITLGRKFNLRLSVTPGPGHYSPHSSRAGAGSPAFSMGQHLVDVRPNTPGVGRYNLRSATLQGPMFSMGKRFYRLHEQRRQKLYSLALKSRPNYRQGPRGLPATNSRGVQLDALHDDFKAQMKVVRRLQ